MNEGLIPSRYAKALHLYAEEAGKAAAVYEQTERLAAGYEAVSYTHLTLPTNREV